MQRGGVKESKQFNFPAVGRESLLDSFKQYNLSINDQELSKPNAQVMHKFYAEFAAMFMHIDHSEEWTMAGKFMQLISDFCDYPELHRESMPHIMFFKELQVLIGRYIGVTDFSMRDLIKPDPTRVRTIMSGLVHFLKFREMALEQYEDLQQNSLQYETQLDEAVKKNALLRKQLQANKSNLDKDRKDAEIVDQENEGHVRHMKSLHNAGNKTTAECKALKDKLTSGKEHLESIIQQIEDKNQQIKLLESRIVSNPEEIKQSIISMKSMVTTLQSNMKEKEALSNEFALKSESLDACRKDLERCMAALTVCADAFGQFQEATQQLMSLRAEAAKQEVALKDLKAAHHLESRKEKALRDKLARLTASIQDKAQKVQQRFDAGQAEYKAYMQNDQSAAQIAEMQLQCKEMRDKIVTSKEDFDDEVQLIQSEFVQLRESVLLYIADMKRAMS